MNSRGEEGLAQGIGVDSPQRGTSEDLKWKARPEERRLRPKVYTQYYQQRGIYTTRALDYSSALVYDCDSDKKAFY